MVSVKDVQGLSEELSKIREELTGLRIPNPAAKRFFLSGTVILLVSLILLLVCCSAFGVWQTLLLREEVSKKTAENKNLQSEAKSILDKEMQNRNEVMRGLEKSLKESVEQRMASEKQVADLIAQKSHVDESLIQLQKEKNVLEQTVRDGKKNLEILSQQLFSVNSFLLAELDQLWISSEDWERVSKKNQVLLEEKHKLESSNQDLQLKLDSVGKRTVHFFWWPSNRKDFSDITASLNMRIRKEVESYPNLSEKWYTLKGGEWRAITEIKEDSFSYRSMEVNDPSCISKIAQKISELKADAPNDVVVLITSIDNEVNRSIQLSQDSKALYLVITDDSLKPEVPSVASWRILEKSNSQCQLFFLDKSAVVGNTSPNSQLKLSGLFWLIFPRIVSP